MKFMASCKTCLFWHEDDKRFPGQCRHDAPRVLELPAMSDEPVTAWPRTQPDDWCGVYQGPEDGRPEPPPY